MSLVNRKPPRLSATLAGDQARRYCRLGFPALIIGGIYSGAVLRRPKQPPSRCSMRFMIECVIYRQLGLKDILDAAPSATGLITGVVFILVGVGQAFSWYISFEQIPQELLAPLEPGEMHHRNSSCL